MAEYEGMSFKEFATKSIILGISTGIAVYALTRDGNSAQPNAEAERDDSRPALAQGTYSSDETRVPTTVPESSATNNNNVSTTNCEPTPPGYITNTETCADYRIVPDPSPEKGRLCVEKGSYSDANKRTLYGMRRVVGTGEVEIIDPKTGVIIGFFAQGEQASFEAMTEPALEDSIACGNN